MKFLFDLLGADGDLRQFALAMGALLVAELGRALLTARLGTSSWDLRLKVEYAVRERVTAKLNALPVAYHQREGVGGLINRMNQAVMGFVAAFSELKQELARLEKELNVPAQIPKVAYGRLYAPLDKGKGKPKQKQKRKQQAAN